MDSKTSSGKKNYKKLTSIIVNMDEVLAHSHSIKLDILNEKFSRTFTGDVFFGTKNREGYLVLRQDKVRNQSQLMTVLPFLKSASFIKFSLHLLL